MLRDLQPTIRSSAAWLLACLALAYVPDMGRGFIADDFSWILTSRLHSAADAARLFASAPMGFYRPLVSLSFAADGALWHLAPLGFAATNFLLACLTAAAVAHLVRTCGGSLASGLLAAGLWAFNIHGVGMALTWISGRTSLLATLFAVLAATAMARTSPVLTGAATLAALLSKEEPLLLPLILAAWVALDGRGDVVRRPWIRVVVSRTWPSFAALAIYLGLRLTSGAMTPGSAPPAYALTLAPRVLGSNLLEYADRGATFAAAALLLGWIGFARCRLRLAADEWRMVQKGAVWLVLGFAITVTIPVRSDLYACFPSVGTSLIAAGVGQALWRHIPPDRRRAAIAAALLLPLLLVPVYWGRNALAKRDAVLSSQVVDRIAAALSGREDISRVDVYQDGDERPSALSAFGGALPAALQLRTGRSVEAVLHPTATGESWPEPAPGTLRVTIRRDEIRADAAGR